MTNCGRGIEFRHFKAYVAFAMGRKFSCDTVKTGFFARSFLRCRTALEVIKVELAPESNNVFRVAYVSFSRFTFSYTKVIGAKGTGTIFCCLFGWLFR